ncbi:3-alpha,7-alpha,12-alpha-trihydroxy-5-beta-cholest-24-enoyl-CoA hydratase [Bordetella genomosp. 1]|uniref:3-alpha,7-alpha, 12-alpha-trihydroxy-5-beta-cholest-24-enoyl-CoA hydratase n=1 Tax=Bordetella genomosp. 1 TaxID=1395607 RepID=A0A261SQ43_9BORD|nr:MaoC/PaaZ C-terminal domain-containing protein [Bordetella genomosp. 1]OZI39506.1 3-alpha,7-alpha,12-alpha-trihydroxy-5-beta-cholest-24-enoyl-CoA hydratase [Bordetella genomosp. 1]
MPISYDTLRHWHFDDIRHDYSEKDAILYALGIGLGEDPLDPRALRYVYEKSLAAYPTLSVALAYPGFWLRDPRTGVDWVRLVHGEQRLRLHRRLPASGTVIGKLRNTHLIDKGEGRGALLINERRLFDEAGAHLATLTSTTFLRGDGGFGAGDAPPEPLAATPDTPPERSTALRISPRAALLYRLNGDYNPLHADPGIARQAGFDRPILHGLCTYGMAARAIVDTWCDGDGDALTELNTRFSAPCFPGETLEFEMWRRGAEIRFRARAPGRGVMVLSHGSARIQS